ncbi:helix-turn-helix domain-containing protein [Marivita hallyeonensis]|uniref:DNA binding domain-containing protein, excisionase family n=1 Tax=Marivita hallyeonensis TaxID=996342 RepID=A0A1M5N3L0_9RHOB|nr:helix-turn-helix domain-containing protein [Marivita hallyeonensis]SHG84166.1 DNA binding domain-containing protein, excisionase family [Marivita hallyeonensis]
MSHQPHNSQRKAKSATEHPTAKHGDVLLTVKEVAELDRCSEKTVRRAIDAGHLKCIRVGPNGRLIRIRKADHAAYRYAHTM